MNNKGIKKNVVSKKQKKVTTSNKKEIDNSNVINLNRTFNSNNLIHTKKLRNIFIVILIIFVLILGRIGYLQFVDGNHLKELAYQQQTINQILSPKRGNIYD